MPHNPAAAIQLGVGGGGAHMRGCCVCAGDIRRVCAGVRERGQSCWAVAAAAAAGACKLGSLQQRMQQPCQPCWVGALGALPALLRGGLPGCCRVQHPMCPRSTPGQQNACAPARSSQALGGLRRLCAAGLLLAAAAAHSLLELATHVRVFGTRGVVASSILECVPGPCRWSGHLTLTLTLTQILTLTLTLCVQPD